MKKITWNDIWQFALLTIALSASFIIIRLFTVDRNVRGYYLSSQNTSGSEQYQIMADIDNNYDYPVSVERGISLDSTITFIERLNKTVK